MPGASLCRLLRINDIYDDDYRGEDEDDDSVDWNHDGGPPLVVFVLIHMRGNLLQ